MSRSSCLAGSPRGRPSGQSAGRACRLVRLGRERPGRPSRASRFGAGGLPAARSTTSKPARGQRGDSGARASTTTSRERSGTERGSPPCGQSAPGSRGGAVRGGGIRAGAAIRIGLENIEDLRRDRSRDGLGRSPSSAPIVEPGRRAARREQRPGPGELTAGGRQSRIGLSRRPGPVRDRPRTRGRTPLPTDRHRGGGLLAP